MYALLAFSDAASHVVVGVYVCVLEKKKPSEKRSTQTSTVNSLRDIYIYIIHTHNWGTVLERKATAQEKDRIIYHDIT